MPIKIQLAPTKGTNARRDLFERLLTKTNGVTLVDQDTPIDEFDYRIYFDTDLIYKNKNLKETSIAELLQFKESEFSKAILDVSQDYYQNDDVGPILTLCTVCSGFVTTQSPEIQEQIYLNTGRLGHIVDTPLTPDLFKEADLNNRKKVVEPDVLWFGTTAEIFTIKKTALEYKDYNIELVNTTTHARIFHKKVEDADIILLPPAFDSAGEAERLDKVKFCLMEGKFVVAPELPAEYRCLVWDGDLQQAIEYYRKFDITDWISKKQNLLKDMEHEDKSLEQIAKCIELIPNDDYFANIDSFLENEELKF